jgi:hypothetical protein
MRLEKFWLAGRPATGAASQCAFLASPRTQLMSVQANAATKSIFDERPIQGFFNTTKKAVR